MPEISNEALIVAIQAVAAEYRTLRDAAEAEELETEEYILLEERERVMENLKAAYDGLAIRVTNLPPYERLVSGK